jgi:hypothetical protein
MKLSEFIVLPQEEKKSTVTQQGVAIAKRELTAYMIFLFKLPHFYVETFCSKTTKRVEEYRVFYNTEHLNLYLEGISLDDLLKK